MVTQLGSEDFPDTHIGWEGAPQLITEAKSSDSCYECRDMQKEDGEQWVDGGVNSGLSVQMVFEGGPGTIGMVQVIVADCVSFPVSCC